LILLDDQTTELTLDSLASVDMFACPAPYDMDSMRQSRGARLCNNLGLISLHHREDDLRRQLR
jgi:hypothetical protein